MLVTFSRGKFEVSFLLLWCLILSNFSFFFQEKLPLLVRHLSSSFSPRTPPLQWRHLLVLCSLERWYNGWKFALSQWETSLQSNAISHWLGANIAQLYQLWMCRKNYSFHLSSIKFHQPVPFLYKGMTLNINAYIDSLVHDCSISCVLAIKILQAALSHWYHVSYKKNIHDVQG